MDETVLSPRSLTVTCVQAEIVPGDPAENTRRAAKWLESCGPVAGSEHLVVFPEYFLQGLTEDGAKLAQALDGPFGRAMIDCARDLDAVILAGFLEVSPDPARPYNSIGLWGPDGAVGVYRKTHLYDLGPEKPDWMREVVAFSPGDKLGLLEIAGIRVGVMTCADGLVPEVPRSLALMGAELIVYPNGRGSVPPGHAEYHAAASGIPIAVCNGCGDVGIETMEGGSRIIDPFGETVRAGDGPCAVSATIDTAASRRQRQRHWPLQARRPELYRALGGWERATCE